MPLTLVPPKEGRSKFYRVRGKYLGVRVDRSTETGIEAKARSFLNHLKAAIERGSFADKPELTVAAAITSYIRGGGERRFLEPILKHFGQGAKLGLLDQPAADEAAVSLYPNASPATRNRQFYTPLCAVLRHAGLSTIIRRPRGAQGVPRHVWLRPDQLEAVVSTAEDHDAEFAALILLLCYTGLRLGEGLRLRCEDISLSDAVGHCGMTKNGEPRSVYLPPRLVVSLANHPRGIDRRGRLFRWSKSGELYLIAERVYSRAGVDHGGAPFHILRHTYGAWMQRAGADLVGTGAWRSATAARVYQHLELSEEARKASMLPGAQGKKSPA